MTLAQGLIYRSMEQNKESRNSPTYRRSVDFWKKKYKGKLMVERIVFLDRFGNRTIGYSKSPTCEQFLVHKSSKVSLGIRLAQSAI